MVALLRRRLRPIPPVGTSLVFERREIRWDLKRGWDRDLQRVREALPEHLHDSAPYRNGRRGLWTAIARAADVPVGIAWSMFWVADPAYAWLEELAVVPEWRRQGVGTRLILDTADWMAAEGFASLASHPITPEARDLMKHLGFSAIDLGTYVTPLDRLLSSNSHRW